MNNINEKIKLLNINSSDEDFNKILNLIGKIPLDQFKIELEEKIKKNLVKNKEISINNNVITLYRIIIELSKLNLYENDRFGPYILKNKS